MTHLSCIAMNKRPSGSTQTGAALCVFYKGADIAAGRLTS